MRAHSSHRVLIVSQNPHLGFALQVMLGEHGYKVRCENNSTEAIGAIKEFAPDTLVTACEETVFVGRRNATDIAELPRPVDTEELLRILDA